ncbi:MAG: CTP synthase [Elusimicrobia bacterium]|nr:CTP synthase [Elusimicrobiota bacterium]
MVKKTKYIFVTGGVVSSLGKGITSASVGALLKARGLKVGMLKIDPYLNVDPGTMSPYQHGEVFVTEDGAETDLDLGHYERFLNENLNKSSNVTAGEIYDELIRRERKGEYLGKTVQVVPHLTDLIKAKIKKAGRNKDVAIVEIGGTVGDIEGLPFLEAIRQFKYETERKNILYMHISLVPYIKAADEIKTKPTQHSAIKLREIGIDPDIIICRTEKHLTSGQREKIALFCDVPKDAVIEEIDVGEGNIYKVPLLLHREKLDRLIFRHFSVLPRRQNLKKWETLVRKSEKFSQVLNIAVAGKYTFVRDAYKSIKEALFHATLATRVKVRVRYIDTEKRNLADQLNGVSGVIVPGGFGERGTRGKMKICALARKKEIPFLGICLGMQLSLVEMARAFGLKQADSQEFNPATPHPVIAFLPEQKKIENKGGTMRLGGFACKIIPGTKAAEAYGKSVVFERHRHRYEFNNDYREFFERNGVIFSGINPERNLVEIAELKNHPWFVAVQFHPEFKSRFFEPHPLFSAFVSAAKSRKTKAGRR